MNLHDIYSSVCITVCGVKIMFAMERYDIAEQEQKCMLLLLNITDNVVFSHERRLALQDVILLFTTL